MLQVPYPRSPININKAEISNEMLFTQKHIQTDNSLDVIANYHCRQLLAKIGKTKKKAEAW